jgi:hypothetical protein
MAKRMIKNIYNMNETEINEFINENLKIKKEEKEKYGEVFTPGELINKMLDTLPKSAWTNENQKWLEPSAGVGYFMIMVYQRLMKGLSLRIKDRRKRSEHIIKNMLYMVEINKSNCKILKEIFGNKSNIFCADFLSDGWQKGVCDDVCFDIVIGNPPFQDDYGHKEGMRTLGGKSKLYQRIFLKAYSMLKYKGYLTFVTPDNIFSGNTSETYQILIRNHVTSINLNSELANYFPTIQQPVCYFTMHKIESLGTTNIENTFGDKITLKLLDRPVNPIRNWTHYTEKLTRQFVSNIKNNAIYNRGKPIDNYKGNKYPIIYTPEKTLYTNNIDLAVGYGIKKAIIFSISVNLEFKMDYNGDYGIGPNTFYIPFISNYQGKKLQTFLNSNEYKILANATKTTRLFLKNALIQHLNLSYIFNKKHKTRKHKNYNSSKTKRRYN